MAEPTINIKRSEPIKEQQQDKAAEEMREAFAAHGEAIRSFLVLIQDLHDSGLLEILHALLNSKEKVASIVLEQILKPSVLNTIKNAMSAVGMVSKLDPDQLNTLTEALVSGLERGKDNLESGKRVGLFDLAKALRDPSINRTLSLLLGLAQGMGQKL
ncbi:DUF1641 domain-containing protein [Alicyclobacillus dauci]|uniref:DUF1641 domain-containing protein n=1 Tax=Alicyclobacillus dauci TaxID=1475485 RepID=A0ABY6Z0A5_9BACL|nr:DUF1641 domain-containing protein [Alicyclobacillus dauci]WAH36272.1 DUF1641 domain-containing protein [Alicyclobacillus dauci]WAH39407.1 DUF1641 domain-containing protein [Alicyclobacillus dauci]